MRIKGGGKRGAFLEIFFFSGGFGVVFSPGFDILMPLLFPGRAARPGCVLAAAGGLLQRGDHRRGRLRPIWGPGSFQRGRNGAGGLLGLSTCFNPVEKG